MMSGLPTGPLASTLDGVASGHKPAGDGPVDNTTPQSYIYRRQFFVQPIGASSGLTSLLLGLTGHD